MKYSIERREHLVSKEQTEQRKLNHRERQLIEVLRSVDYGEVHIFVKEGQPVRLEQIKKSIMLKEQ